MDFRVRRVTSKLPGRDSWKVSPPELVFSHFVERKGTSITKIIKTTCNIHARAKGNTLFRTFLCYLYTIQDLNIRFFSFFVNLGIPWVPEVFLACGRNFRCWPKAEATSVGHYKDSTETGNRARKVSGTQGNLGMVLKNSTPGQFTSI